MRLVTEHHWRALAAAFVTFGPVLMSYASMTEIVRAGKVYPIGTDGEVDCA